MYLINIFSIKPCFLQIKPGSYPTYAGVWDQLWFVIETRPPSNRNSIAVCSELES